MNEGVRQVHGEECWSCGQEGVGEEPGGHQMPRDGKGTDSNVVEEEEEGKGIQTGWTEGQNEA